MPLNNGSFMVDGLVEKYMKTTKNLKIKSNNYFLILIKTFRWVTWPKISGKWTSRIILGSLKTSHRVRAFGILNFGFPTKINKMAIRVKFRESLKSTLWVLISTQKISIAIG